jgi:molecular chaperone GrpE
MTGSNEETSDVRPQTSEEPVEEVVEDLTPEEEPQEDYLALAQRTQADLENYRKRAAKEIAAAGQRAKSGLVRELLPVVDNLERALQSAQEGEEHLLDGVKLVHAELVSVLARNGVEPFDPAGEKFDPTFHEAISTREEEDADAGVVLDVVEKGYRLNGTVLRPARVVVSG